MDKAILVIFEFIVWLPVFTAVKLSKDTVKANSMIMLDVIQIKEPINKVSYFIKE